MSVSRSKALKAVPEVRYAAAAGCRVCRREMVPVPDIYLFWGLM
ncbi:MAG: hypothetical protein V6Z89_03635 [Desulfobacter sp.]